MTSLVTCIRRAGKALPRADAEAIREIQADLGGAASAAVDEYIGTLEAEHLSLIEEIEAQAGDPSALQPLGAKLTMDEIDFDTSLSPEDDAVQRRFAEEMTTRDWSDIKAEYARLDGVVTPEETKGGLINSVDAWRELSPDYRNNRSSLSVAVHEIASALSKKYFAEVLAKPAETGEYFIYNSGGTGAGKTTGLALSAFPETTGLIFDSNMAKLTKARQIINDALASGRMVGINHVIREPIEALRNGAVSRSMRQEEKYGSGRIVPLLAHVRTHIGSAVVIKQLYTEYKDNPRVEFEFIDNTNGKGRASIGTIESVLNLSYAADENNLMEQGRKVLDNFYENGHPTKGPLSDSIYRGFVGQDAVSGKDQSVPGPVSQGLGELHSKPEQEGSGRKSGLRQAELQLALSPAVRALVGTAQVHVVQSTSDIPGTAVPTDVEGVYRGGNEFWLVADNLPTAARAKQVFAHEAFGHMAMERMPEFDNILASVKSLLAVNNKAFTDASEVVSRRQPGLSETSHQKEILAYMAENGIENGVMARAYAAVRAALRRMGLLDGVSYTEAEIKDLLVRAARDLVSDAAAKQQALAAMPLQEQMLSDPEAVADTIYLAINEIYAGHTLQDRALSLYGELNAIQGKEGSEGREADLRRALYMAEIAPGVAPDVMDPDALYSVAFHGTNTAFDNFDINFVGSGQGSQNFGFGLYFTKRKHIADWFRKEGGSLITADIPEPEEMIHYGEVVNDFAPEVVDKLRGAYPELFEERWISASNGSPVPSVKGFAAMGIEVSEQTPELMERGGYVRGIPAEHMNGGELYQYIGGNERESSRSMFEKVLPGLTGSAVYMGADKLASKKLLSLGIPGHSFATNDGKDVHYVVYDDSLIKILNTDQAALFSRQEHSQEAIDLRAMRDLRDELQGDIRTAKHLNTGIDTATLENTIAGLDRDIAAAESNQSLTTQMALFSRYVHPDPEIEAMRGRVMAPALEDITTKDRVRGFINRMRGINWLGIKQGILDSAASVEALERGLFGGLLDASQSAYKSILSTRNLGSVMAAVMHRGIPIYQNGVFVARSGRKGLIEIFEKITHHQDGNLLPLWELYATAKRAGRLINEKNPDGTSKEKVFSQADIDKALTLETQYPEFKTAFMEWQAFNGQLLDLAIKNGVINGDEAKIWRQNDYVPFYRAMEDIEYDGGQGQQTSGGIANVRSGVRRLTGSDKPLGNVFENMVMNTSYLIDAVYRNTAMQRIVAMTDGIAMHKVPMAFEAIRFSDGDLARALMKAGLIVGQGASESDMFNDGIRQVAAMSAAQKEHWSTLFRRVAPRGPNIVSVLLQGKPVYYEVTDPLLLRTIGSMGAAEYGGMMNTFRFAKKTLTNAVTIDPAFMMANFIRDTLSTAVITKGSGTNQIIGAMKGLKAAWDEDPDILAMMMAGAGGGGFYDHNPTEVRKMLAKKMPAGEVDAFRNSVLTPRGLWRFWQKVGNASEQANRVAVYRRVIADGGTAAEAAYQARDVLNFTMSGDYEAMKAIVATVPFLNARMQGLYRLARGGAENPVGFAMKGLALTAASMALLLRNLDDDRYKELPEWDKDTYWHFFIGSEHFRLPKPFEVGAIFATIPERAFMLGTGDDSFDTTIERGWRMLSDTFAFNPVPQAIKPILEQYSNRNSFTGNPIIGLAHQGLEPEAQYDPWTSETMRELAKILPGWAGSPKRLESFMRGYFGSVGMYALGASDAVTRRAFGHPDRPSKGIRNYPVLTRFWRDPNPRTSKYSSQLYDMLGEADSMYRTMNAYRTQQRVGEAAAMMKEGRGKLMARAHLHDIAGDVRKVNQQIRAVQFGSMDADKKKAAIDRLNGIKLKILAQVSRLSDVF